MKYAWIKQHRGEFTVLSMCRFLQVSQSAYYGWLHRVPSSGENLCPELFENQGHYFGAELSDEDKYALIEFLKTR